MLALLTSFSWQELRHHPWRNAAAMLAVMLGVALAFSVHLINVSALDEFAGALRATGGQPDLELRATHDGFDEALYGEVAMHPDVAMASPVVEAQTLAAPPGAQRQAVRIVGIDPFSVADLAPALVPVPARDADRLAMLTPGNAFLNPAAQRLFGHDDLQVQVGLQIVPLAVAGHVSASGPPLAVMDIAAAQELLGRVGKLSRIDIRLKTGVGSQAFLATIRLPAGVLAAQPEDANRRVGQLSRAYRVNLTVLALVALFTGSFLVFSVLALSVARRAQQLALLGVLGLTSRQRTRLVIAESLCIGAVGSVAGLALGTTLAALALRWLGGDLGGGYFPGVSPRLAWSTPAALAYGALGIIAAGIGGWLPARMAGTLPVAQTLKGLGTSLAASRRPALSLTLLLAGAACALLPPVAGLPVAAYLSVALLLVGGITALPALVSTWYDILAPRLGRHLLPLLAVERARRVRESAAVAISGVVAALSLAVALTVMVASFRDSVSRWLDVVLPADLYVRTAASSAAADTAFLPPSFVDGVRAIAGVARVEALRLRSIAFDPALPPVTLLARQVGDPERGLPLVQGPVNAPPGSVPVYVSEAMVDLYDARPGQTLPGLASALGGGPYFVAGVWRDYVRQTGAIAMERSDYIRATGDDRANDLQVWLAANAEGSTVRSAIRELAAAGAGGPGLVDVASATEIRSASLRIFDRSFAVTYWLQAVAIAVGLFGIAASFSAQVLARRKEFGLLAHLGLTRRQILGVVAGEGAAWTFVGAFAGVGLGLAVALVLVHVVNPQSFHWTMDLVIPWLRLGLLCLAVVAAGTFTAWLSAGAAAGRSAVLAVKEDW